MRSSRVCPSSARGPSTSRQQINLRVCIPTARCTEHDTHRKHGPPTHPWVILIGDRETDHMHFIVELGSHWAMRKLRVSVTSSSIGQVEILQIYSCFSTKHFWSKTWGFRSSSWFGLSYPKPLASWPLWHPKKPVSGRPEYGATAYISVFMTHLLMLQLLAMY